MSSVLLQMGEDASQHADEVEEVKRILDIRHDNFDGWIYSFLENKCFNVPEAVAKLHRRLAFEQNELAKHEITDYMRLNMREGIIQIIGEDKEGSIIFYINTRRDFPTAKIREERTKCFDIWLSYGIRLRKENKRSRVTFLINQEGAGVWTNTDMVFQSSIVLRIAKYFPGVVGHIYVCNMGNTLSMFVKPIFAKFPAAISERIIVVTKEDMNRGLLREVIDNAVIPVELGGSNNCDNKKNYDLFADIIESYWADISVALKKGMSLKEYEMQQINAEIEESKKK
eukprot:Tbor_TRINITY_DN4899_c0_g1::TRINITY_DN4899_c0_g1_i2::g.1362::m.1362